MDSTFALKHAIGKETRRRLKQPMKSLKSIMYRLRNRSAQTNASKFPGHQSSSIKVGLYQHFKGNRYYVFGTARHSEDEQIMVVYATEHKRDELWVRPLQMFEEHVETEKGDVQRFVYISKSGS